MKRTIAGSASLLVLAAAASGQDAYDDSVDLQVAAAAAVKGTIRGVTERESFAVDMPAGAVVSASAKRRGKNRLVPRLDLVSEADAVLPADVRTKGKGSTLKGAPLGASGFHRVRVFGDGTADGDYQLKLSVKPRAKWHGEGTQGAADPATTFQFAAPAGAKAKIVLRAAKGSPFVPELQSLVPPGGGAPQALSGGSTGFLPLPETGTWSVTFDDGGTVGGDWTIDVTLRLPKVRPTKANLSAGKLTGSFVDQQPVYGRLAGDGAALEVVADVGGIAGTSVTLEPGALPVPVVITMSEVPPFELPEGQSTNGPAIQFGPDGTTFTDGQPAKLTLPYDPNIAPEDLTIYVRDETTGEVAAVPKPYEFPEPGLVTFPAPHFTEYAAASSRPRSFDGSWVYAGIESAAEFDFGGRFGVVAGDFTIRESSGGWTLSAQGTQSRWSQYTPGQDIGEPSAETIPESAFDVGAYESSDDTLFLYSEFGYRELRRSARGDVMYLRPSPQSFQSEFGVFLRRARGNPTPLNLAGRWHVLVLTAGAEQYTGTGGPEVELDVEFGRGTATFATDGTVSFSKVAFTDAWTSYPGGTWNPSSETVGGRGSFTTSGPVVNLWFPPDTDAAKATPRDEIPPDAQLRAALGGEVLLGSTVIESGDLPTLLVFVREGTNVAPSALVGITGEVGYALETVDRTDSVQGFRMIRAETNVEHADTGAVTFTPLSSEAYVHLTEGSPSVDYTLPGRTQGAWTLARTGRYDAGPVRGAIAPGGGLLVAGRGDGTRFDLFFGVPGEEFRVLR